MNAGQRWLVVMVAACGLAGCANDMSPAGVKPGGAQDNDLVRGTIDSGGIPAAEDVSVSGILNQHDLPLAAVACKQELCINTAYAAATTLDDEHAAVFVQLGFDTGIDPATFKRPPLNLAVVVDRSGSMADGDKLVSVRAALHKLVARLGEADRLAIVIFDHEAELVRASAPVTDRPAIGELIDGIGTRGSTDMAAGLREGFAQVAKTAGTPGVQDRVMVFTDAMVNTGTTDETSFVALAREYADRNIGLTLYGVGQDLNQSLVLAITKLRGGTYSFLSDAQKISTLFDSDFDLMVTPVAYDVEFVLQPKAGFSVREVYGAEYDAGGSVRILVPTLFLSRGHGALVVRLEMEGSSLPSRPPLAELSLKYVRPTSGEVVTESVLATWGSDTAVGAGAFYSQPGVRKTVAVLNAGLAIREACRKYWAGSDVAGAKSVLGKARAYLQSEASFFESSTLAEEARLVDKLDQNLGEPGTKKDEPVPMQEESNSGFPRPPGCSAGGAGVVPQAALLLLGLLALRRGKKRN